MAISFATIAPGDMDIGPCLVSFDGTDLGGTSDNVIVNFKYEKSPISADQVGGTLLDEAISKMEVSVTTSFLEMRNKTNFAKVFPNFTTIGATSNMENKIATRQLALAKVLFLHPLSEAAGTAGEDFNLHFYKAVPSEESDWVFSPTEQRKLKIVWKIYLDLGVGTGGRMFRYGDKDTV